MEMLRDKDIFVDNFCNGTGVCGKCKIKILEGTVSEPTEAEKAHLSAKELEVGIRLACMTHAKGEVKVQLLKEEQSVNVLTEGYLPAFEQDEYDSGYGIAVDIGTTTVVSALIRLKDGRELASASALNPQKQYGQDVLTRITYEWEHPEEGIEALQRVLVDALNVQIREACRKAQIDPSKIRKIAVAANCTMMHMLLGVDARSIGRTPYKPAFLEAKRCKAADIGLEAGEGQMADVYCLPQVSAFIGADIVAGVQVCGLQKRPGNVLFIDMGTNGEIVLSREGKLLCCSCAAGPALEGMNISCGMRAEAGAVEEVRITERGAELTCIDGKTPTGICGSGALSAVRELVKNQLIKKNGTFRKMEELADMDERKQLLRAVGKKREFVLSRDPELTITQNDVRQIQLAKGAIRSGFQVLLEQAGLRMEELDEILIAGQFGAHLSADLLTGTGILPKEVEERITYVGNTAKTGAYLALLSDAARQEMEDLAQEMEYMELSQTENYDRIFAECMMFPEGEGSENHDKERII